MSEPTHDPGDARPEAGPDRPAATPPSPATPPTDTRSAPMLARVRRLLTELETLSAHRGEEAARLTSDRDGGERQAQGGHAARREEIENRRLSRVARAQEIWSERERTITSELDEREASIRRRHREALDTVRERAEANQEAARRKLEEAVWLAESVYEGSEDKPADKERIHLEGIEGRRRQITEAIDRTRSRHRRSGLAVREPDDTAPPPAATEPPDSPEPAAASPAAAADGDAAGAPAPRPDDRPAAAAREHLERVADRASAIAAAAERSTAARIFGLRMLPPLVLVITAAAGAAGWGAAAAGQIAAPPPTAAAVAAGAGLGVAALGGLIGHGLARRTARRRLAELAALRREGDEAAADLRREAARLRAAEEFALLVTRDRDIATAKQTYEPMLEQIEARLARKLEELDRTAAESLDRVATARRDLLSAEERKRDERIEAAERDAREALEQLQAAHAGDASERHARFAIGWDRLVSGWNDRIAELEAERAALDADARRLFPAWDHPSWEGWSPPHAFAPAAALGRLAIDRRSMPGSLPDQPDFQDPMPAAFELPVTLDFPDDCSLLVLAGPETREAGLRTLQASMMRLLAAIPPGKARFTIVDPIGLGESFAGFMHLGDHDESLVGGRIWTETRHVEQRLADLTEHMEHVIQKYLRNAYESIADYNAAAGEIAEPYRFLVIADFPAAFSESAAARLASILSSGPRCGVFTLILADERRPLPPGLDREALESAAIVLREQDGRLAVDDPVLGRWPLEPETPPAEALSTRLLHAIGEASKDARRVEVPFDVISPPDGELWTRSSERDLVVPLGKAGATRHQELVIGPGTSQHALIAGKTGSGKSTLMHVLITNLAQWYGPDEVRFYLVDFKKGVEFKTYATHELPHAMAVAVESDREFGLSVLERIDEELRQRGERFRAAGVQDVAGWRRARPEEPMPRILLLVDEFQELFVEDDRIGQDAALLMDRIVRQGRAFGVHVILGSQTLGGSYSLPRSTLGQMQVRIALQCSESDAYLIMSDDNAAARLLARPGEAIYNDAGGRIEGNSPFQIVWLPEGERERRLTAIRERAEAAGFRRPEPMVVFEGNVPADLGRNERLMALLRGEGEPPPRPTAWLGEAIAIKGPTEAVFERRSGSNLLIVGQREESAAAMVAAAGLSLAAGQRGAVPPASVPPGAEHVAGTPDAGSSVDDLLAPPPADDAGGPGAEDRAADPPPAVDALPLTAPMLVVLDGTPPDAALAGFLESVLSGLRVPAAFPSVRRVDAALVSLAAMVRDRTRRDAAGEPPVFLIVHGLHRFRDLRPADEFGFSSSFDEPTGPKPDRLFAEILEDGPAVGVHVIAWCDTVTNLMRSIPRQGLREFDLRVAFQMGGADSTQFIDAPDAANLGLQRALFFSEEAGRLETFRPYARPEPAAITAMRDHLDPHGG